MEQQKSQIQFEFTVPLYEINESIYVGETGKIIIPVEVLQVMDGMVTFKKIGQAESPYQFHKPTLMDIRESLPKADA